MSWITSLWSEAKLRRALRRLGPGDLCVDCGANIGEYTEAMARTGARVIAFEPDPNAFAVLVRRIVGLSNVECRNAAVAVTAGTMPLYYHRDQAADPVRFSKSSTLFSGKRDAGQSSVEVETIDFVAFVRALPQDVALLKMDIEGAEVPVLAALLEAGLAPRIGKALVELHDRRIPELGAPTAALRAQLARAGATQFDLTWQ